MNTWNLSPALLLAAALAAAYYWAASGRWQARGGYYFAGLLLFAGLECSPLHHLGTAALFSAHMVVHVGVLLLAGPLLVLGLPPAPRPAVARALAGFSDWLRGRSALAWAAGVGLMWLLHVPAVFDASFAGAHGAGFSLWPLLPAGTLLLAGALFSWPLFGPVAGCRLHPLAGVVYLFTACVGCSLLGLLIAFAPAGTYQHYARAGWCGPAASNPANPWGITQADDQQAAGLIMWVPCCLVYLGGCLLLLGRYFTGSEAGHGPPSTVSLTNQPDYRHARPATPAAARRLA